MDPYYGYQQPGYGSPYMGGPHMPPPQQQYYPQGPAPYAPYGGQMGYNQGGYGMGVCPKCGGTGYRMSKKGKTKMCKCVKKQQKQMGNYYGYSSDSD